MVGARVLQRVRGGRGEMGRRRQDAGVPPGWLPGVSPSLPPPPLTAVSLTTAAVAATTQLDILAGFVSDFCNWFVGGMSRELGGGAQVGSLRVWVVVVWWWWGAFTAPCEMLEVVPRQSLRQGEGRWGAGERTMKNESKTRIIISQPETLIFIKRTNGVQAQQ